MTLPPNSLPTENPALSGDLLAVVGQPAAPADAQPAAPFAALLADVGTPTITCALPAVEEPVAPPVDATGRQLLYSSLCYTTLLQPATVGLAPECEDEPVAETISPSEDAESTPEDGGARLLAYQLIAGQWVPQPEVVSPAPTSLENQVAKSETTCVETCGQPGEKTSAPETRVAQNDNCPTNDSIRTNETRPANDNLPAKVGRDKPDFASAQPFSVPADSAGRAAVTAEKIKPAAKPAEAGSPAADKAPADLPVEIPGNPTAPANAPTSQFSQAPKPPATGPVKFAAPGSDLPAETVSEVNSLIQTQEKKPLITDGKGVKSTARQVGTGTANRELSMPYSAVNKSSAPVHTDLPQPVLTGNVQRGTTAPVAETSVAAAVQAPRLVQEIHAIADRISTIDRNTVEVRFDFNEAERLSVRVEYRDGTVHTTFRTDSDTLRNAISREWQVQAVSAEPRAYRVAEPVFSANNATASSDLSQSGHGSGQSHGRASEQNASHGFPGFSGHGRSSGASAGHASIPAAGIRPETSHHLHTFA